MKSLHEINKKKVPAVRIDSSLDRYDNVVLFPEKLAKANQNLDKAGVPKISKKKYGR